MKKSSIILGLFSVFSLSVFLSYANAEYDLKIDEKNNEVYLASGNTQITLKNIDKHLSWLNLWTWADIASWTTSTWTNTNSGTNVQTWSSINSGSTNTGNATSTWMNRTLWSNVNAEIFSWDEFDKALYRMYMNWLTKYNNKDEYRPYDNLTREESAKMIGQLYSELWFTKENKWFNCNFVDTNMFDPTLAEHIYNVCRRWIFRGNDQTQQYMPHDNLTKGQLLAVLLRIFEWKMSKESWQPWWIEYYVKASSIWLTNEINLAKFDQPVSRQEAALLIFRFKNMVIDESQYKLYLARLSNLEWDNDSYLKQIEALKSQRGSIQSSNTSWQSPISKNPDSNWITTSGSANTWSSVSLDIIAWNKTLTDTPEFMEAINRMYDMWMTSYNTTEAFMPYQTITRAQVAKMLDKFTIATNLTTIRNFWNCNFSAFFS